MAFRGHHDADPLDPFVLVLQDKHISRYRTDMYFINYQIIFLVATCDLYISNYKILFNRCL